MSEYQTPRTPNDKIEGMAYFPRLCEKVRLHAQDLLHPDYHGNLGGGFDLWTCQFLQVDYGPLSEIILGGASDEEALEWALNKGVRPSELEVTWWNSYMRNRGFRDDLAELLTNRKAESGFQDRDEIATLFDYIDADEGRL